MRTTVDLDTDLLERLRNEARRRGVPFKEVLASAVRSGLSRQAKARPSKYRCPTFHMGSAAEHLNLDKALHIAATVADEETARELARRK